jgi:hypothetical protein
MSRKSHMQVVIEKFGKPAKDEASSKERRAAKDEAKKSLVTKLSDVLDPLEGEDKAGLQARLFHVSNRKLLALMKLQEKLKKNFGDKKNLVEAILANQKRSGDKDYAAKLQKLSVGRLLSIAPKTN